MSESPKVATRKHLRDEHDAATFLCKKMYMTSSKPCCRILASAAHIPEGSGGHPGEAGQQEG